MMAYLPAALIILAFLGYVFAGWLLARSLRAAEPRRNAEDAEIEAVAQAIARCYGHGPLRVMDPHYQHEFRRDARAALAAMRRR